MYPKKFCDINSLNVHTINTDHMIVFTLFVTKNHTICFANIQRKLIDLKPTVVCPVQLIQFHILVIGYLLSKRSWYRLQIQLISSTLIHYTYHLYIK